MEKTEKKNLKKGDLIQLKIVNLDTKGRAYGFFDENKSKFLQDCSWSNKSDDLDGFV